MTNNGLEVFKKFVSTGQAIQADVDEILKKEEPKIVVFKADDGNPDWAGVHFTSHTALMDYIDDCMQSIELDALYVGEVRSVTVEVILMTQSEFDALKLYDP